MHDSKDDTKVDAQHIEHEEMAHVAPATATQSDAEKRLIRKIDLRLLPILWLMYVLNYIDRTNIGNAKVAGMTKDLHMDATQYSTALSIFFVGYLLAEVPSNMILARSRPSLYLPFIMGCWGCLTIAVQGVHSYGGLVALRFCLGIVESGFFPGVMFLLSCWYKPFELAKRLAVFYTASLMSGAFGGLLAGGITGSMDGAGGVPGWKWLFIIEGIATVVVACAAAFILPDFPLNTKWLNEEEREMAITRLITRDSGAKQLTHKQSLVVAWSDWKTWVLTLSYMGITSAVHADISGPRFHNVGTISYFFPTLMTTLGYHGKDANYMTVPIYASVMVICVCVGFSSDHFNEKPFHVVGCAILSAISFIVIIPLKNFTARYVLLVFGGAGIWSATPLFLSFALSNFKNREARAVSIATINGLGNLASVYGSYIWPSSSAPLYRMGFGLTTAFITVGGLATLFVRLKVGDLRKQTEREDAEFAQEQADASKLEEH